MSHFHIKVPYVGDYKPAQIGFNFCIGLIQLAPLQIPTTGILAISETDGSMKKQETFRLIILGLSIVVLWGVYFAVCGAPVGATFIYADF